MDPKGDITDSFDDDALRASIEKADQAGLWRDDATGFVDPKYEQIRKQLEEPERVDYAERRRRDLQRRAAAAASSAAQAAPAATALQKPDPAPIDWRQTVVRSPAKAEERTDDVLANLQERISDRPHGPLPPEIEHPLLGYVRPVLSGMSVFVPITVVQLALVGSHFDLLVRGLVASITAGIAWNQFHAGRFRATMLGLGIYLLAFTTTPGEWGARGMVANMVGFLMTLLGSGLVGFLREQNDGRGFAKD